MPLDPFKAPRRRLGTVVCTTTKSNKDTSTPFGITPSTSLAGKFLYIQPDAACWVELGTVDTVTASVASTSDSFYLAAGEGKAIEMTTNASDVPYAYIACVAVTGTVNLKVFELPKGA